MKIHAVQTGTVSIKESQRSGTDGRGYMRLINTLSDPRWTEPLPIYAWVIEHPEGVIVVDTGETARATAPGYFPWWHPYYRWGLQEWVSPDQEIGPQIERLGIPLGDVRWVVMTHLHTDHAGGMYHLPNAEFIVSQKEYAAAVGMKGRLDGYPANRWPGWFKPRLITYEAGGPVGPFPESFTLTQAGDVQIVPTPGHSPGHQSVIVHDGLTSIFIAGDVTYSLSSLFDQVVDGVTLDIDTARLTLERTLDFVRDTPSIYLPSHDPESAQRLAEHKLVQDAAMLAVA